MTKFGPGDEVLVTRSAKPGERTTWRGVILAGDSEEGFSLRGVCLTTGNAEHSWFSGAEVLKRTYGCIQTVTRAE
ncbi:hypothetical protein [Actinoallomurus sp. CA-142502]|uniref:hypothetical protein n=1 Tax=Actinoallomurus sp. CA-142502 TaxID=3239885 RepID=UPI003D8EB071